MFVSVSALLALYYLVSDQTQMLWYHQPLVYATDFKSECYIILNTKINPANRGFFKLFSACKPKTMLVFQCVYPHMQQRAWCTVKKVLALTELYQEKARLN